MEERRLLLAVALSLLVLMGYQMLFPPPPPPPLQTPQRTEPAATIAREPAEGKAPPESQEIPTRSEPLSTPAEVSDTMERRIEVTGERMTAAFSNRGATLVSWRLIDYTDSRGRPEEMIRTLPAGPQPLGIRTGQKEVDSRLKDALFQPSTESLRLSDKGGEIRFDFVDEHIVAEKSVRFEPSGYVTRVTAKVSYQGRPLPIRLFWGPGVGQSVAEGSGLQGHHAPRGVALKAGEVERYEIGDLATPVKIGAPMWAGVESQFFAALWIPDAGGEAVELHSVTLPQSQEEEEGQKAPMASVDLGESGSTMFYVGPKDHEMLSRLGWDLERVVEVGDWIGPLVVPLLRLLRWVHGFVGNYGWSIVVLTLLINLLMAPLRHYSISNSLRMAKLAPEMRVIQDRYRKVPALDSRRQEMQKEIAALYSRHGMSMGSQMMVGCLPLLLTMPFLFAFYRVLQVSIDLRGADFLWIPDLSQKDPLFLTPVLMGVSMLIMQKMMPSNMDATQQRMMMIMPVVLVVMLFAAPGGLNLYWLASNLCSITQQGVTLKLLKSSEAQKPKQAKRRRK